MVRSAHGFNVTIADVEYRTVGGEMLLAKLYQPSGRGPFPGVIGVHGGAWSSGDRHNNAAIDGALAAAGVVVMALDFRLAPKWPYPASVEDVNFATRWFKAHADIYHVRADRIGVVATSSGAHIALMSALWPGNPVYVDASAPFSADASVAFFVACWPISDPAARYQMALEKKNDRLVQAHRDYFNDEAAMTVANPYLVLQAGQHGELPPLLLLQGTADNNVTPDMAQKFANLWAERGGGVDLDLFLNQPHTFVTQDPSSAASVTAIEKIKAFVLKHGVSPTDL